MPKPYGANARPLVPSTGDPERLQQLSRDHQVTEQPHEKRFFAGRLGGHVGIDSCMAE
jgi:hypothetical protein